MSKKTFVFEIPNFWSFEFVSIFDIRISDLCAGETPAATGTFATQIERRYRS
jgi:hypothetical protein